MLSKGGRNAELYAVSPGGFCYSPYGRFMHQLTESASAVINLMHRLAELCRPMWGLERITDCDCLWQYRHEYIMVGVADRLWVGCGGYLSCTAPPWCLRDYQSNSNQPKIYLATIMLLSIYFALSVRALHNRIKEASGMHHYCPSIISGCVCSVNSEGGLN